MRSFKSKRKKTFFKILNCKSNDSGQVTVFLIIVFMAVVILCGIFIDAARIKTGETYVRRSVENAAKSVLASYDSRLKENYGLFAIGNNKQDGGDGNVTKNVERYIKLNISQPEMPMVENITKPLDLYGFRIEKVNISPIYSFIETEVFKKQILEYMKYSVPEEMVEDFLKKIGLIKETGTVSLAYGKKINIEEDMGFIEDIQKDLKINISGGLANGEINDDCVEQFNKNGSRDKIAKEYEYLINDYINLNKKLIDMEEKMMRQAVAEKADELDDKIQGNINSGEGEYFEYLKTTVLISQKKDEIFNVFNILREKETNSFINQNKEASKNAKKLLEMGSGVIAEINELRNFVRNEFETNYKNMTENSIYINEANLFFPTENFKNMIDNEIDELSKILPDETEMKKMIDIFEENVLALENALNVLDEIEKMVENNNIWELSQEQIFERVSEVNLFYKKAEYNYDVNATDKPTGITDPREALEEVARDYMKTNNNIKDINLRDFGINVNELPSRKKFADRKTERLNELGENIPESVLGSSLESNFENGSSEINEDDFEKIEDEIAFSKKSTAFPQKAIDFFTSIIGAIPEKLEEIRDKIYINEYVMEMFSNKVESLNSSGVNSEKTPKITGAAKGSIFDAEVEYILHGSPSENVNILKTKGQILLIRFILNTLHIYMDKEKNLEAAEIAAALAGWWTGGAGIPIVKTLIVCAWGMGESVFDLKDLMNGKSIPFYKTKDDWKLDLNADLNSMIEKNSLPENNEDEKTSEEKKEKEKEKEKEQDDSDSFLDFNYTDYLRLFLFINDSEIELKRMLDIIEINIGKERENFKIENTYAGIKIESEISMKYLFLTGDFMPLRLKTNDGRHVFRTTVFEEY